MSVDRTELPPVGPDPLFTFPRPVKHTLANGLTMWAVEHGAMPVVSACPVSYTHLRAHETTEDVGCAVIGCKNKMSIFIGRRIISVTRF